MSTKQEARERLLALLTKPPHKGRQLRKADAATLSLIDDAMGFLAAANAHALAAACPASVKKIKSAMKSLDGARRHAERAIRAQSQQ
jgi:hypothetical protein